MMKIRQHLRFAAPILAFYFLLSTFYSLRPALRGVAHMALWVSDIDKARGFYTDFLGFQELHRVRRTDGTTQVVFLKVNENQYIELRDGLVAGRDRLHHISFYTEDAGKMREYLSSMNIEAHPGICSELPGNRGLSVRDPEGHAVEITEYSREGKTRRERGKFLGDQRISNRIMHVGIIIGDVPAAMKFYDGVFGLKEFWRGQGRNSSTVSWINMRVPEGEDYIEFMLYAVKPAEDRRGSQHHICLEVDDIERALERLEANPYRKTYSRQLQINTGVNRKRQLNLFDPDGTRIELMEPRTVDGNPTPPTTAPLPEVKINP